MFCALCPQLLTSSMTAAAWRRVCVCTCLATESVAVDGTPALRDAQVVPTRCGAVQPGRVHKMHTRGWSAQCEGVKGCHSPRV